MKKKKAMNLQKFAEGKTAVQGKQIILLIRVISDKPAANVLALETEHTVTMSKDASTTSTKQGTIRTPGQAEVEISASCVMSVGDTMIGKLRTAMETDELVEVWRANLAETGTGAGKYKGTYYQGYVTNVEESAPADGQVDVSLTFGVNGTGKTGDVTVPASQVEEALYAFKDTVAQS